MSRKYIICARTWSIKLLLVLASTVTLGSESRGTHDHILLSHDSGSRETIVSLCKNMHVLPHIRLVLTVLPWKRNLLFIDRTLLVTEYRTKMKSILLVKAVSTELVFHVRVPGTHTVVLLKITHTQFYLGRWPP
jgi:hypothetical protein